MLIMKIVNVQCDYTNKDKAAEILIKLNKKGKTLIKKLDEEYKNSNNKDAKFLIKNLKNRYRGIDRMVETNPNNNQNDTSFTVDKGWLLSMCIRNGKNNISGFHDLNTLTFVYIHELSHIASNVQDHPTRFWEAFKWLLKKSIDYGLYEEVDYEKHNIKYCDKMHITYSPYYDNTLDNIDQ